MSLWKLLLVILFKTGVVRGAVKTWSVNTNYDNPNNWDLKRIPCGQDRAIFPAKDNVSVFMPKSVVVRELILPNTGLLIFPTDGSLVIGGDVSVQYCPGQDVKFIGGQRQDLWYDPYNWNISSELAINLGGDKDLLPVPHFEQIPCERDDVVFPKETSFKLYFDGGPIKIGSLSINDVIYNSEDFRSFVSSDTGKILFVKPPEIVIRSQTCSDATGCLCDNDQPQIMSKICSIVAPKCPKLQCYDPIHINGHCCPICGTSLTLEYTEGFSISVLARLYSSYIRKNKYRTVQTYSSKTRDNKIQSIFTDKGRTKGFAHNLATEIRGYLNQDSEDQKIYNLKPINLLSSTNWLTPSAHSSELSTSVGTGIGIFFAVLFLIVLVAVFYFFYRKRRIPGFTFIRFDSSGSKVEMELGTTPHEMLEPIASSSSVELRDIDKGFDNPLYEKSGFSLTNPSYKVLKEEEKKSSDYRENPAYMVLDDADE